MVGRVLCAVCGSSGGLYSVNALVLRLLEDVWFCITLDRASGDVSHAQLVYVAPAISLSTVATRGPARRASSTEAVPKFVVRDRLRCFRVDEQGEVVSRFHFRRVCALKMLCAQDEAPAVSSSTWSMGSQRSTGTRQHVVPAARHLRNTARLTRAWRSFDQPFPAHVVKNCD